MWIGIDGEGKGRDPHRYTLLVAASENEGYSNFITNSEGLSTEACLRFIASVPAKQIYSFAFGYDLTKILKDLDNQSLYFLMRPELRPSSISGRPPTAVNWGEFKLNLQGTKFSVKFRGKITIVWDVFRFFQCKFTKALEDWKILSHDDIEKMEEMKNRRGQFEGETDRDIYEYCVSECRSMATLARKLTEAHEQAGVRLKNYFGAGSTGAAILDDMGIRDNIQRHMSMSVEVEPCYGRNMRWAVMSAFFGGRFENSVVGSVKQSIWSADISSAYPYQLCFMPCLEHGEWKLTTRREDIEGDCAALVNWHLDKLEPSFKGVRWGPFPFRMQDGAIIFPVEGGSGWVWKDEFLAGEKLFSNVRFNSAWVLKKTCDCVPFPKMGHYYRERVRIGKTGPGIVFKLGPNSVYGKLAQSVGNPQYQCWIWAGMITSGCRAQILESMGTMENINNVLAIATDGIYALEKPDSIAPQNTGTWETKKPLGGWELSEIKEGMFFGRPGINFPLDFGAIDMAKIRGRGFGRKSIYDNRKRIVEIWEGWLKSHPDIKYLSEYPKVDFPSVTRFVGAKSSTRRKMNEEKTDWIYTRDDNFGEWKEADMFMSFAPNPKRSFIDLKQGFDNHPLGTWSLPQGVLSVPYKEGLYFEADETDIMSQYKLIRSEQPDWYTFLED